MIETQVIVACSGHETDARGVIKWCPLKLVFRDVALTLDPRLAMDLGWDVVDTMAGQMHYCARHKRSARGIPESIIKRGIPTWRSDVMAFAVEAMGSDGVAYSEVGEFKTGVVPAELRWRQVELALELRMRECGAWPGV